MKTVRLSWQIKRQQVNHALKTYQLLFVAVIAWVIQIDIHVYVQ